MVALRNRPLAAFSGPFWFSAFCAAFTPTSTGYQDLAAFLAPRAAASERVREHMIASPFGTIHAANFQFARPIGTAMPETLGAEPVNFDPRALDVKVWTADEPRMTRPALHVEYPVVNRQLKGDRLPVAQPAVNEPQSEPQLQPIEAPSSQPVTPAAPVMTPRPKSADQIDMTPAASQFDAANDAFGALPDARDNAGDAENDDDVIAADKPPEIAAAGESEMTTATVSPFASLSFLDDDAAERTARIFFGAGAVSGRAGLEQWAPGAEPILVSPAIADPDIKLSALEGPADGVTAGETIAGKGDTSRMQSPAERLSLLGKPRAKAEKCLADAVYFEARGEPLKGQEAVAQVVMNRVFSGFYPNDVCSVVYQNANRHLACQFTFACEGKDLSRIDEPDMWSQAKQIAKDTLDGKIWLADVGHATHYHAYWVHPSWVNEMKKMLKLGVHTFYRPRAWGDNGSEVPSWGSAPDGAKPAGADGAAAENPEAAKAPAAAAKPEAAKGPQAAVSPEPAGNTALTAKL
jgi:hypothetical protein